MSLLARHLPGSCSYTPLTPYFFYQASKRYLTVARSMKRYEDEIYEDWLEAVASTLPGLLKKTVLAKPPATPIVLSSSHSLQRLDSRTGSRPTSKLDYSYLFPPGKIVSCCGTKINDAVY